MRPKPHEAIMIVLQDFDQARDRQRTAVAPLAEGEGPNLHQSQLLMVIAGI
jgi:hypothetical protein